MPKGHGKRKSILRNYWRCLYLLSLLVTASASGQTQSARGVLSGRVLDPTGAAIPGAIVRVLTPSKKTLTVAADSQGFYRIANLETGNYQVNAKAEGFSDRDNTTLRIVAGQTATLNISLAIAMAEQNITVMEQPAAIEINPANNASSTVIQGNALAALSTDPDELRVDLMALAGLGAGPNGGQMFIDGFSRGQPPPKSAIREIRINQNPFSARYDKPGEGRIEIFTKPGADHWHGNFRVVGNDEAFNAQNPFLKHRPPGYHSVNYNADVGGALNKKASFSLDISRRDIGDLEVIDTPGAPEFGILPVNAAIADPRARTAINPRLDYQVSPNNTLTASYEYWRNADSNSGLGQFSLASLAYDEVGTTQTYRISDSQTVGAAFDNQTRFQFERDTSRQLPHSTLPTLNVEGYFDSGGNSQGNLNNSLKYYEFQNYTSVIHHNHQIGFGARLRESIESNYSTSGFNGTFIFNSAADYAAGNPYQFTETALLPGGSLNTDASYFDVGLYLQDDWKVRPNVTLSAGLRFESQTAIHDHADWAPRIGLSWGIDARKEPAKTVLRAGWGIFYDRFTEDLLLNARRLSGSGQQSYVLYGTAASPLSFYPNLPSAAELQNAKSSIATTYQLAPNLRAPYVMQASVSVERQITKKANMSVTYLHSRGEHQFFTNNVNAPFPSTYDYLNPASASGANRPNGINENIFEYESAGIYRHNQVVVSGNVRAGSKLSLFSNYELNSAHSDAVGANSFPSNPYRVMEDYGRADFDAHQHFFFGGSIALPHAIQVSPFLVASAGRPYNIELSQDLNGSTVLNQRPAFASSLSNPVNVVTTSAGTFDTVPVKGETLVPYNYLDGPGSFSLHLRLTKTFGFGGERSENEEGEKPAAAAHGKKKSQPQATDKRYQVTFSVAARNVLNKVNKGTPSAILDPPHSDSTAQNTLLPASASPFFGISNSLSNSSTANRTIYLSAAFSF